MSPLFRKIVAATASLAVFTNSVGVPATFAATVPKTVQKAVSQASVAKAPTELKTRLKAQKSALEKNGKTAKYSGAEIRWNDAAAKPNQITGLKSRTSKNVANDVQAVFDDLSPLYAQKSGAKKAKLVTESETVSKLTGEKHVRLKQSYSGLPVIGADVVGHVSKDGNLYQIDGDYVADVTVGTTPSVTSKQAVEAAVATYGKQPKFKVSKPELAILSEASGQNLVWQFDASFETKKNGPSKIRYVVDAKSGKTIRSYETVAHNSPVDITGDLLPGEGGAQVALSGTLYSGDGNSYMWDPVDRLAYVYNFSTNTGTYSDAQSVAFRSTPAWWSSDPTEVSAAYNLQKTLDFYKPLGFTVQNIAFSATGQTLVGFAVHYGDNYNNAFWNPGDGFYFGDGDGTNLAPLATLDVVAHEFSHAWTENTSGLVYLNEAGALNESFSDIMGTTVELLNQQDDRASYPVAAPGKGDWLIGEDILRLPGIGYASLRDMRNPANTSTVGTGGEQPTKYKGTYWYSGTGDNGGVHQNSGVQNFFYYLLSEGGKGVNDGLLYSVDGIGLQNAARVAYEANSNFVTSEATYQTVRQAWIDAANAVNPAYAASVANAWDAVGVNEEIAYPAFVTADESFENDVSVPAGWTTSGSGNWTLTNATGAIGNNSLQSPSIADKESASVTYAATTDTGYLSFFARTSTEKTYDKLKLYVDGDLKNELSWENAWMPVTTSIANGTHEFTWTYAKDNTLSGGLDQVGIDAVHIETMTGTVDVTSTTGSGNVRSKNGLAAIVSLDGQGTYLFQNVNADTITRASASGTVSIPLVSAPDGANVIRFQYKNARNFVSPIYEKTFFVDSVAPTKPSVSPFVTNSQIADVAFEWTATDDTGSGLPPEPYRYEVSKDFDFTTVAQSGTTSSTGVVLTLGEGAHFFRVIAYDVAGNSSASDSVNAYVDTVAPDAPTDFSLNGNAVIGTGTVGSAVLSGLSGSGEIGNSVNYEIHDRNSAHSTSGTLVVWSDGRFASTFDLSSFDDGMVSYSAYVTDSVGNVGATALGTVGKSVVPADGSASFLSGAIIGSNSGVIRISANKTVDYEVTGDVAGTYTGTVTGGSSADVALDLSAGDGAKTAYVTFADLAGVSTSANAVITVDTASPTVSITSHPNGGSAEGSQITLTGSVSDTGGLASLTVWGQSMPISNGNWTKTLPLPSGDSTFEASATDSVGHVTTVTVTVTRTPVVSDVSASQITGTGFVAAFATDVDSLGSVAYWTDANALTGTVTESNSGTSHSATVSWLAADTQYYFKAYGTVNGKDGTKSSTISVKTPKTATSSDYGNDITATGSVWFQDSSSTGAEFGNSSGSVTVYSDDGKHSARFPLDGLVIGTNGWDGKFSAPKTASVSGSVSDTGYSQTGSVFAIGNDAARLSFSGKTVTVKVEVGAALNGKTLRVYHSNDGTSFQHVAECVVSASVCQFEADHFSYYGFAVPSDSVPDAYSFAPKSGAEFSSEVVSDPVTLTGFNAPATVTVGGGSYSVNNAAFVTGTSTVNSGDSVRVKVVSSANALGTASATLNAGWVSATFTVTSKNAVVRSSSGGGGGGGGGYSAPVAQTPATKTGSVSGTGTSQSTETNKKNVPSKKNVKASEDPYAAAGEIAKTGTLAKLGKNAASNNVPQGVKPKIDRLVVDRIVKSLDLEGKTPEARSDALAKAAAATAKLAKSKTKGGEKAVLSYVSEQLSQKAADAKKPAKKKNVRKPATNK